METKVISIHRTAVKLYSKQISIDLSLTAETLCIAVPILPPQHKVNEKKKVNILLNQSMNQYCYQANNVLE